MISATYFSKALERERNGKIDQWVDGWMHRMGRDGEIEGQGIVERIDPLMGG